MPSRREILGFCLALSSCVAGFYHEALLSGRILSPADVLGIQASFGDDESVPVEPRNRLLMDPVLQFQPWLAFNRAMIRSGRLPLWNPSAGCGAPHLANGQSAVFDPFHLIAYLGPLPRALGLMAAARCWVAGLGMFLLASAWGLGRWGRWFAGLVYPFCGFLVVWLLFPVTAVAIWLPWLLLATGDCLKSSGPRPAGRLALVTTLVLVGGHIQTSAHVLLASGLFVAMEASRAFFGKEPGRVGGIVAQRRGLLTWSAGILMGLSMAAVQVLPLGCYLSRSPVWGDRVRERPPCWALARPRILDAACTAIPYVYGSQRQGHPNLARPLGVHNLNESAGGFTGLATLLWLAPLGALRSTRGGPRMFLIALVGVGAMGAFRLPPVDNVLRAIPVLEVTDNRRLTLWLAFGLTLLGGMGLDVLARGACGIAPRRWSTAWLGLALLMGSAALALPSLEPALARVAQRHYERRAATDEVRSPSWSAPTLAERQVAAAVGFLPRYYAAFAAELVALAVAATVVRRRPDAARGLAPALLGLTLTELACFGIGLNPAISAGEFAPRSTVIDRLRQGLAPGQRALGIGEELPPNTLMARGLADPRNYDSIELSRSLDWFAPLYDPSDEALTSRRGIRWDGVARARGRLAEAAVRAVVGAQPPPAGAFSKVERVGAAWIAWIDEAAPWAGSESGRTRTDFLSEPGRSLIRTSGPLSDRIVVRETWDPGWRASVDGRPARARPHLGTFLAIDINPGEHTIELTYEPAEFVAGLAFTAVGALAALLALAGFRRW